ncbi:MAG: hypothetical protein KGL11_12695 [Alphaproteobacteria bacterium]|nr:hypothetical protein [Alphaproteobacteria bacterium]
MTMVPQKSEDLARHVSNVAYSLAGALEDLRSFLKFHCNPAEFKAWDAAITSVETQITEGLLHRAYANHPTLKADIDERIRGFGEFVLG